MYEWDNGDDLAQARPVWRRPAAWVAAVAVVAACVGVGLVVLNRDSTSNGVAATTTAGSGEGPASTAQGASTPDQSAPTSEASASSAPEIETVTTGSSTTTSTKATSTTASVPTSPVPPDTDAPTTVAPAEAPTYSTLPDGSPAPIIAVFSEQDITLSGAVPNQEAKDKLQALAIANSKFQVPVNNLLTIDPTVPIGIGVRVVELTSARFAPNSAEIEGLHALELDRIVSVMNALPNVTALIIGHADQIGSDAQNFKISAARAAAVVNYLVSKGVAPSRLSSRAVGDTDLLTLNDDAASLALNRRTEIVFYGLLGD